MKSITNKSIITLESNTRKQALNLIKDYELVKCKKHPQYTKVEELLKARGIKRQNFYKFYGRYKNSDDVSDMFPLKRGRKAGMFIFSDIIQKEVLEYRNKGFNKYEISNLLSLNHKDTSIPKPTSVYNILKRNNLNKIHKYQMSSLKRKIYKERADELGHIDCHVISKGTIEGLNKPTFLVGLKDDYSRLTWVEHINSLKSIDVMFGTLRCLNHLNNKYGIKFEMILSDNGSEFKGNLDTHPFELLMREVDIKHIYTRPYRPQTNGKIERHWKTLQEELIADYVYKDLEELKEEILAYNIYYNEMRMNQSIETTPINKLKTSPNLSAI